MLQEGQAHVRGRRLVLPAFGAAATDEHAALIEAVARRAIASWPRDVAFALHPYLRTLTLETLLRTIFAGSADPGEDRICELRDRLLEMLAVTASAVLPEPLLRHGPGHQTWTRFLRRRARADGALYAIIDERLRTPGRPGDLLDRLLHARNPDGCAFSRRRVRDDLMSIVLAGHETTASELAWAFQLLAHNPRVLDRLSAELDAGGEEYLSATVKEVLRHRPVFLFAIPRAVKQTAGIGGFTYRPPAHLLACIYLVHHDPAFYPQPEEFRPERFLEAAPPRHAFLAWGGGRKRCPGLHLASLEIKTLLRTVLASMAVRPAGKRIERPRWRSVIVTPHAGCRVVLESRSSRKSVATRH
jgi:cytochrome P450